MIIRPAKKEDIEQIYNLFLELYKEEDNSAKKTAKFLKNLRKKRKDFEKSVKKELLKGIRERNSIYLVAEIDNKLVGYCYGQFTKTKDPFFKPSTIGYLHSIIVNRKFRGKGIAKKLHQEIIEWFKKKKCSTIYLEVFVNNSAISLYKGWNYKTATCKMWRNIYD